MVQASFYPTVRKVQGVLTVTQHEVLDLFDS